MDAASTFSRMAKRAGIVTILALVVAAALPTAGGIAAADHVPGFQVSPTAFDFGDVRLGTSEQRVVTVTNRSGSAETVNLAGGAAPGPFDGSQNCQGVTLQPDESCQITYTFRPTESGEATSSTSVTLNGQGAGFDLRGLGVGLGFTVEEFQRPTPGQEVKAGAAIPVIFHLLDAHGTPIPAAEAQALSDECAVRIGFTAGDPSPDCARYDEADDQFVFQLKTKKGAEGTHTITVVVEVEGAVETIASIDVVLR